MSERRVIETGRDLDPKPRETKAGPAILIVDDDTALCALMSEYLQDQGCVVDVVHDGRAGLAAALRPGHDLIILDVMLPVIDGFEVLRQLRRRSRIPVI